MDRTKATMLLPTTIKAEGERIADLMGSSMTSFTSIAVARAILEYLPLIAKSHRPEKILDKVEADVQKLLAETRKNLTKVA